MSEKKRSKTLSKSSFIRGRQCLKSLYLYKNRYFLRDPISYDQQLKFRRGHHIGVLAQKLFPGGINLSPRHPSQQRKAAEDTLKAIKEKVPVIYEAVFMTDKYVAIMDILVLVGNEYHAWEVKSSLKISETYLQDLSFQYFVMSESGFKPEKIGIIYLNSEYRLNGELEPEKVFIKKDLTEEIILYQKETAQYALEAYNVMFAESSPEIEVGPHCFLPYPCEFYSHCHKKYLQSPILNLAGLSIEEKYDLLKSEAEHTKECNFKSIFLQNQCLALQTGQDIFDKALIKELFDNISTEYLPVFLHILSVQKTLPEHQGDKLFMRKPMAAALSYGNREFFKNFSESNTPLNDLIIFIEKHAPKHQILIFDEENLLPDQFTERLDDKGFELINIFDYFASGIWCSKAFAPDYSPSAIRNNAMKKRPQYFDHLALLLDLDKEKIDNPDLTIKNYVISNLRSIQEIYGRLYAQIV